MRIWINDRDIIWSYLGTFMSLCANIITLPFIIYYLDGDMLGIWYIFVSIGTIANLFDFGFSVTFARNITYCWSGAKNLKKEDVYFSDNGEVNFLLFRDVLAACKSNYLVISSAAIILLSTIGSIYIDYVTREIESDFFWRGWVVYLIAIFLNLYYGYYAAFLRGVGAISIVNKSTILSRSIQILTTVVLLKGGCGILGACIGYLAYGFTFRVIGKYKFYRYKNIGGQLKKIEKGQSIMSKKELFLVVWHNAWRDGVVSISNYFCNQISTIICSMYFSLTETGIYSLGVQIAMAISMVASSLYSAYQPAIQAAYVNNDKKRLRNIMSLIIYVYILIFIIGLTIVIFIGIPILKYIRPEVIISIPVLFGISVYQFILKFRNCYTSYFSCTNRLPYVKSFVISAVLCIGGEVLFMGVFKSGIWGLIAAQILSQAVFNVWYWPAKVHEELDYTFPSLLKNGHKILFCRITKSE